MRDGWLGLNTLTDGAAVLPDEAVDIFGFSGGQASFDAAVEVAPPSVVAAGAPGPSTLWCGGKHPPRKISQLFFNP
jgi:hypothetical protein